MGEKIEQIEDPEELAQVRRQARVVYFKAFLAMLPLLAAALLIPPL